MTVRQLCIRALRFLGVVSEGSPTATDYDIKVAWDGLIALYLQLIASGAFGPLTDVAIEEAYTAGENERVINITDGDLDVTLPATIEDTAEFTGQTITRTPYDKAIIVVAGLASSIYDADLAIWIDVDFLTLDDDAPLSGRYGTGLAALLAVSLCADYGQAPTEALAALANEGSRDLYMKRRQLATLDGALSFRRTGGI